MVTPSSAGFAFDLHALPMPFLLIQDEGRSGSAVDVVHCASIRTHWFSYLLRFLFPRGVL